MKKWCSLFFLLFVINNVASQTKEEQAIQLYEQKSLDAAQQVFQEILDDNPKDIQALEYLANIAFDKQEYKKAASYIEPLMNDYPDVARYHFKYAGAIGLYAKNNRLKSLFLIDDVKKHFHKAVDLDESFVDGHLALVHLYLELPVIFGGSKEKALIYAKEVEALDVKAGEEAMRLIAAAN